MLASAVSAYLHRHRVARSPAAPSRLHDGAYATALAWLWTRASMSPRGRCAPRPRRPACRAPRPPRYRDRPPGTARPGVRSQAGCAGRCRYPFHRRAPGRRIDCDLVAVRAAGVRQSILVRRPASAALVRRPCRLSAGETGSTSLRGAVTGWPQYHASVCARARDAGAPRPRRDRIFAPARRISTSPRRRAGQTRLRDALPRAASEPRPRPGRRGPAARRQPSPTSNSPPGGLSRRRARHLHALGFGTGSGQARQRHGVAILAGTPSARTSSSTGRRCSARPIRRSAFGALAGGNVGEPSDATRRTPLHDWAPARGAVWETSAAEAAAQLPPPRRIHAGGSGQGNAWLPDAASPFRASTLGNYR